VVALAALLVPPRAGAPVVLENGTFVHDCCGSLRLHDGEIILNEKAAISYTVGRDERGPYVLPRSYVGSYDEIGLQIDGARPATKLRLDRVSDPTSLLVPGERGTYVFRRSPGRSP
jgi:hypothetical protein